MEVRTPGRQLFHYYDIEAERVRGGGTRLARAIAVTPSSFNNCMTNLQGAIEDRYAAATLSVDAPRRYGKNRRLAGCSDNARVRGLLCPRCPGEHNSDSVVYEHGERSAVVRKSCHQNMLLDG